MSVNLKQVVYFRYLPDPVFEQVLATRSDIDLTRLEYTSPPEENWQVLARSHVYQITAARDDLPAEYFADAPMLARCPKLLALSTMGAGYDTINVDACTAAGVLVVNQAGGNREAVAEHVLALMLGLVKRVAETDRMLRSRERIDRNLYMGSEIKDKTIGIIGLGHVGSRVAELCRGLFSMRVLAYDPYLSAEQCAAKGAEKVELETLLRDADFVSINCPRTAESRNLIGAREYGLMKPGAYFVTTARGGIHDEMALADALASGHLAGAGLDVWDPEPPPPDHPLLKLDNVISSPHTAGVTRESRHNVARIGAEQIITILDGGRPPRLINPEVWPRYVERYAEIFGRRPEPQA